MANWKSIRKKIKKAPKTQRAIKTQIKKVFEREKAEFIQDFLVHPVTREIQGGTMASNTSNTLEGYGNLFTFIGFSETDNPIDQVLDMLVKITKLKRIVASRSDNVKFDISIRMPDQQDFKLNTPLPWENGRSWVLGIERGISGFGAYMYDKMNATNSRSGRAFQAKAPGKYIAPQKIRPGRFRNVKYMSEMIRKFYTSLTKEQ